MANTKTTPQQEDTPKVQLSFYITESLRHKLRIHAATENLTVTDYLNRLIAADLKSKGQH